MVTINIRNKDSDEDVRAKQGRVHKCNFRFVLNVERETLFARMSENELITRIKKLAGTENYEAWSYKVKLLIMNAEAWEAIEPGFDADETKWTEINRKANIKAYSTLCLSIEDELHSYTSSSTNAKAAWKTLETRFKRTGNARRQYIMRKMFSLKWEEVGSAEKLIGALQTWNSQLRDPQRALEDEIIYQLITSKLPESFDPTIQSLNARERLPELTELYEILRCEADRKDSSENSAAAGHALSSFKKERPKNEQKQKIKCSFCKKRGHNESKCWFKNGKPQGKNEAVGAYSIRDEKRSKGKKEQHCKYEETRSSASKRDYNKIEYVNHSQARALATIGDRAWIIDSGAEYQITSHEDWMEKCEKLPAGTTYTADGTQRKITGRGTVRVKVSTGKTNEVREIKNVALVPDTNLNLLSVGEIVNKGFRVEFHPRGCEIKSMNRQTIHGRGIRSGNVFILDARSATLAYAGNKSASTNVWHARLGHLGVRDIAKLYEGLGKGISQRPEISLSCEICILANQKRESFKNIEGKRAQKRLELIHTDICGPMQIKSIGGARYMLTMVNDYSRWVEICIMKDKTSEKMFTDYHSTMGK